jgi:hypothetical protein
MPYYYYYYYYYYLQTKERLQGHIQGIKSLMLVFKQYITEIQCLNHHIIKEKDKILIRNSVLNQINKSC